MIKKVIFWVVLLFSINSFTPLAAQELVKGYYDTINDWFVYEYVSPEFGLKKIIFDPDNKVKPTVKVSIMQDNQLGDYIFNFTISNGNEAKQVLSMIVTKFFSSIYGQAAPSDDWYMDEYRAGRSDTWKWFNPDGVIADKTQGGFSFRSKGLPTIVEMFFFGERRVRFTGPSPTYDPDEIHESFDSVSSKLEAQYPVSKKDVTQKTLGPKDPPVDFKPVDFLDYIIDLKHQAALLGWITNKGIENSLDQKLDNAKKKLEQGNITPAKNMLNAFINEVEAQNGKHITAEAYGLLKYNVQYLINKL